MGWWQESVVGWLVGLVGLDRVELGWGGPVDCLGWWLIGWLVKLVRFGWVGLVWFVN